LPGTAKTVISRIARSQEDSDSNSEADYRMRLKRAVLFAVGFLFVTFWLLGGARCQSSPPLDRWENIRAASPGVLSPRTTAKGSPPPAPEIPMYPPPVILASPPTATDDVPPRTATARGSARSAAAKNSPLPANDKDAPAPAVANILPTPGIDSLLPTPGTGKLSPSQEPGPDGFTVGIDDGKETGQPLPIRPRPAKQSKVRQKPDTPSAIQSLGDAEIEKLKPKLVICRGC
jgi:hypothetical protein